MAAHQVTHPSADALRAFALGKLSDPAAAAIMNHLDSCPDCCKQVAALSGDDFLDRLRQRRGPSFTHAPGNTMANVARAAKPAAGRTPVSPLPPELAANQQYEILRELGRGGMGVVYLAKNKLMDRLEVLKVVNKALLDHPGAVERFLREIRSAAKLSHANVVGAYHALQQGELLAFTMEYIEGQDLASLVKSQGPLPIPHACFYVQQAASGLQHAYEKQMVHRDIKPQNLILAREGKRHIVKVLDFGLAKVMREKSDDTGLTGEGKMLGTPDYIAPEQTLDAAKADIRADIYSLGCTLYYLLSGHPPFSGTSLGAILVAHQMHEAKALNLVRPEVPEELAAVVRKMMAKSPAQRYQTPLEVVQALSPFVKQGATPKAAPESSAGTQEVKTAVKTVPPVAPSPEPAQVWGSLTESSAASTVSRKSAIVRNPRAATVSERTAQKKWLLGGGIGAGVLLLALLGMWAGGVFEGKVQVKTKDGILVLEVNEPNPEVLVDGETVTVSWHNGGKKAEIHVNPGTHKVEIQKDGFSVDGKELTFKDGDRVIFTARLLPEKPQEQADAPAGEKAPALNPRPVDTSPPTTPRNDYDDLAKGRWVRLLPSQEEFERLRSQKSYIRQEPRFDRGILETEAGGRLIIPVGATNILVRTRVRKLFPKREGGPRNVGLSLRLGPGKTHFDAWLNEGGAFGIQSWNNSHSPPVKLLATRQLSEDYEGFFEFAFAAVGDQLTVYANGRRVLEAHGPEIQEHAGSVMVGGDGLFQDIEVQVLDPPAKSPSGGSTEFQPLFNGKNLSGWMTHATQPGNWRVEDGILIGSGPSVTSHLYTARGDYTDFHLRLEARINEGGNSGVYFRTPFGPTRPANQPRWLNGYNAKIDKNRLGGFLLDDWSANVPLVRSRVPSIPSGQWLTLEVIVQGNHILVKTNGETTAEYTDEKRCFARGHIALQQHTPQTLVEFRAIEIKELPATKSEIPPAPKSEVRPAAKAAAEEKGFVPLFNGKDLKGWRTHPKQPGNWHVVKGVLIGSGPALSHLYSFRGNYRNFHLRVEARINDGGNSGIYFRAPFGPIIPPNNPIYLQGYEAQINANSRDPRKTGSLIGMVQVSEAPHKPNEWFTMDVIAEGNHIVIKVNDKKTADYTDDKRLFTGGHIVLQQADAATVAEFRKIEIKERK